MESIRNNQIFEVTNKLFENLYEVSKNFTSLNFAKNGEHYNL